MNNLFAKLHHHLIKKIVKNCPIDALTRLYSYVKKKILKYYMTKAQPTLGTGSPDKFVSSVLSFCGLQTFSNHITLL